MFEGVLRGVAGALDAAQVPYMIIGAQAVLLYGEPRLTQDIDVTLGLDPSAFDEFAAIAHAAGWRMLPEDPAKFVRETFVLPCMDDTSGTRIDFVFSNSEYEREALGRAKRVEIEGVFVRYASPEDVIIHKTVAGRARDLDDIRSILGKCGGLDAEYIEKWLKFFDRELNTAYAARFHALKRERA